MFASVDWQIGHSFLCTFVNVLRMCTDVYFHLCWQLHNYNCDLSMNHMNDEVCLSEYVWLWDCALRVTVSSVQFFYDFGDMSQFSGAQHLDKKCFCTFTTFVFGWMMFLFHSILLCFCGILVPECTVSLTPPFEWWLPELTIVYIGRPSFLSDSTCWCSRHSDCGWQDKDF